ncbi:hypothetical protein SORBI_3003G080400 [Sorghum bicolor]|uniref:Wall-associated receptor kinase galacturonan-binding domain-containing protein n=1 Tax=Sorghum bicolor TaxID=4558 RepID=A0A1B6Q1Z6_SORBI|nr:hypothetical protein SORBI_3003G080400 [Sorghum bicolor]
MAPSLLLLLLVSSPVLVALSLPLMIQPVVASDGQGGEHCHRPQLCGNVTISFPFGLIPDGADQTNCSDVGIGSKVRCYNNSSLYLEYSQIDISMQIRSIFYDNRSLHILPRRYWHPYFNTSSSSGGCRIPTADTIPVLAPPLSNSPANQNLIFYNCTKPPPPPIRTSSSTTAQKKTRIHIAASYLGILANSQIISIVTSFSAMFKIAGGRKPLSGSFSQRLIRTIAG